MITIADVGLKPSDMTDENLKNLRSAEKALQTCAKKLDKDGFGSYAEMCRCMAKTFHSRVTLIETWRDKEKMRQADMKWLEERISENENRDLTELTAEQAMEVDREIREDRKILAMFRESG